MCRYENLRISPWPWICTMLLSPLGEPKLTYSIHSRNGGKVWWSQLRMNVHRDQERSLDGPSPVLASLSWLKPWEVFLVSKSSFISPTSDLDLPTFAEFLLLLDEWLLSSVLRQSGLAGLAALAFGCVCCGSNEGWVVTTVRPTLHPYRRCARSVISLYTPMVASTMIDILNEAHNVNRLT